MRKTSHDGGDTSSITSGIENEIKKPGAGIIKTKRNSIKRKVQNFSHESDDPVIEPLLQKDKDKSEVANKSAKYLLNKTKTDSTTDKGNDKDKLLPENKNETSPTYPGISEYTPLANGMKEKLISKSSINTTNVIHNYMNTNIFSSYDNNKILVPPKTQILVEIDSTKQSGYNPSPLIFTTAKIHTDGQMKQMEPVQVTPVPILSVIEGTVVKSETFVENEKKSNGKSISILNNVTLKHSNNDIKFVENEKKNTVDNNSITTITKDSIENKFKDLSTKSYPANNSTVTTYSASGSNVKSKIISDISNTKVSATAAVAKSDNINILKEDAYKKVLQPLSKHSTTPESLGNSFSTKDMQSQSLSKSTTISVIKDKTDKIKNNIEPQPILQTNISDNNKKDVNNDVLSGISSDVPGTSGTDSINKNKGTSISIKQLHRQKNAAPEEDLDAKLKNVSSDKIKLNDKDEKNKLFSNNNSSITKLSDVHVAKGATDSASEVSNKNSSTLLKSDIKTSAIDSFTQSKTSTPSSSISALNSREGEKSSMKTLNELKNAGTTVSKKYTSNSIVITDSSVPNCTCATKSTSIITTSKPQTSVMQTSTNTSVTSTLSSKLSADSGLKLGSKMIPPSSIAVKSSQTTGSIASKIVSTLSYTQSTGKSETPSTSSSSEPATIVSTASKLSSSGNITSAANNTSSASNKQQDTKLCDIKTDTKSLKA